MSDKIYYEFLIQSQKISHWFISETRRALSVPGVQFSLGGWLRTSERSTVKTGTMKSLAPSCWNGKEHVVFIPQYRRRVGESFHELACQKESRIIEGQLGARTRG